MNNIPNRQFHHLDLICNDQGADLHSKSSISPHSDGSWRLDIIHQRCAVDVADYGFFYFAKHCSSFQSFPSQHHASVYSGSLTTDGTWWYAAAWSGYESLMPYNERYPGNRARLPPDVCAHWNTVQNTVKLHLMKFWKIHSWLMKSEGRLFHL